jgi:hypothetical protein
MEKIVEIASSLDYQNLAAVEKLKYKPILAKEIATVTKLFTIATSATNLHRLVKKSDIQNKDKLLSYLSKITNTTNGLLGSEALEKADVKKAIEKMQARYVKAMKIVSENLQPIVDKNVSSVSYAELEELEAEIKEEANADEMKEIKKILSDSASVIKGLQSHAGKLPSEKTNKPFVLVRVPVVAISNLSSDNFKAGGFNIQPIGNYSILHDQLVVGINPDMLEDTPADKFVDSIIKGLSSQTNIKFAKMSNPKPYANSGLIYYWLVSEPSINQVRQRSGKNFSINKWGFAFN